MIRNGSTSGVAMVNMNVKYYLIVKSKFYLIAIETIECSNKIKAKDFVCKEPPIVEFKNTKTICANTSVLYKIGFTINKSTPKNDFIPYYDVCYNEKDCSVNYTNHQLLGGSFNKYGMVPRVEKAFTSFSCKIPYYDLYTQENQRKNPRIKWSKDKYLQRGHLFPDRDAPVYTWKLATYLYGNCAPEWNVGYICF